MIYWINAVVLSDDGKYRLVEQSHLNKNKEIVKRKRKYCFK